MENKSSKPLVYMTRKECFSSAHRLNNRSIDDKTNCQIFGKCNAIHGHNYTIEVTVKGVVDVTTGMVLDMTVIKDIISETVLKSLDHKFIDEDVPYFRDNQIVSTSENISIYIWKVIAERLPTNVTLDSIKLFETDKNIVIFRGQFA
ncbi:6-pyruvoyl tetrahydrobiopterin synthase-like [Oppia nitens]|uniref:6-pyruvoyl tetrahydrobiopterin synthase-like n=1 Tax=Oppia nitens TaxID=1686743 RepID=UPI0023DCA717|nr:6-pyruvoyl tetrahydrobiopterin synthase-like [Oppia nitens]